MVVAAQQGATRVFQVQHIVICRIRELINQEWTLKSREEHRLLNGTISIVTFGMSDIVDQSLKLTPHRRPVRRRRGGRAASSMMKNIEGSICSPQEILSLHPDLDQGFHPAR